MDNKKIGSLIETFKHFDHITYKEKIDRGLKELGETNPNNIIKWGRKDWDNNLGGIYGGKVYVVGCETGGGKTTFLNQLLNNISDQGYKVVRYSLEDRMEDNAKEELYYTCNRLRKAKGLKCRNRVNFVNNDIKDGDFYQTVQDAYNILTKRKNIVELEKSKMVTIGDLVNLIEEQARKGARVVFIDHLHYFNFKGDKRLDLEIADIMHDINEVCRKFNLAVFLVAHYKNTTGEKYGERPSPGYFKDAAAIKQVANYIIQIQRDFDPDDPDPKTIFRFTKKRGPIQVKNLQAYFDISTYSFLFDILTEKDEGDFF